MQSLSLAAADDVTRVLQSRRNCCVTAASELGLGPLLDNRASNQDAGRLKPPDRDGECQWNG